MSSRLTSVANVKRFLALTTTGQDALIDQLIPRESLAIERYCGRRFGLAANSRRLNGSGTPTIVLPEQPILSVTGLTVNGLVIAESANSHVAGYVFDDTAVTLTCGAKFPSGVQNVAAVWSSGYQAVENTAVPSGNTPTLAPSFYGFPMAVQSVAYTGNGTAFVQSTGANAPLVGHFSFADGVFSFNAADNDALVTLSYSYAPADVEQSCIEMVGLDLKQRDNLGVNSKSLAGESISYEKASMSASVKGMLQPYVRRTPG